MDDYQEPESDGSLEFWMWCEEQAALHAHPGDDEPTEIEIIPEDLPF